MLEFIPSRQVSQRLSEGWQIVSQERGDYAALMRVPEGWEPVFLKDRRPVRTCLLEGCGLHHYALGYCYPHWRKVRRYGTPMLPSKVCSEVDCHRKSRGRGLCEMHLARVRRAEKAAVRNAIKYQCLEAA